jgi:ABC-type oligopeptide transport system ATPase subunit
MTGPLLEVEDLMVHYPVPRGLAGAVMRRPRAVVRAVDGVSFRLEPGELVALVGESGCGKTSTAQAVMRLVDADAGAVRFEGQNLSSVGTRGLRPLRRRIQMVYQDPYESLDPRQRVRQAVEEPLVIHRLGGAKAERDARVREALERVELTPPELFLDRYPHELSGGQRQRVAIAAALVLDPVLLVADEPVSMLDVSVRAGVLSLLDGLKRDGLAILMITHDRAALGGAAARPARAAHGARAARRDAGRRAHPGGLPVPSALPNGAAGVPRRRPRTPPHRDGPPGRLHPDRRGNALVAAKGAPGCAGCCSPEGWPLRLWPSCCRCGRRTPAPSPRASRCPRSA